MNVHASSFVVRADENDRHQHRKAHHDAVCINNENAHVDTRIN